MDVSYTVPLQKAWERMSRALFKPFDLKNWFIIGFTAFLADLIGGQYGGGAGNGDSFDINHNGIENLASVPAAVWNWLMQHPAAFFAILLALFIAVGILLVLLWLKARGKFMFLDNVIYQRAQVSAPWHEYREQGHSLFVWYLFFSLLILATAVFIIVYFFVLVGQMQYIENEFYILLPFVLKLIFAILIMGIPLAFIGLMLDSFVVPIMHKYKISVWQAWKRFLALFSKQIPHFILYALLILVLKIAIAIGLFIFGFLTCCVGFILLIIPYISAVVTLPITYFFRAYSVDFLQQFGEAFHCFPKTAKS